MLIILSPAKTVNFDRQYTDIGYTEPIFKAEAAELIKKLREYDPWELARFMKVSDQIAEATFAKHMAWDKNHHLSNSKQAVLAYFGIVFQALKAEDFNIQGIKYAQKGLRILSGLYGVLRPTDLIQPYRLEMGLKLDNSKGNNLYSFWQDMITDYFNKEIAKHPDNTLINLASKEYSSVINFDKFTGRTITPVFKEYNKGKYKIVTVSAKKARGMMTRYLIKKQIQNVEDIKNFEEEGYYFEESESTATEWVFFR
jgi:cytoplasmic iron level regulating protein YaaA (DUF328/UPF0246 family)